MSLIGFTEYTNPRYRAAAHHCLIAEKLEAVLAGRIDRLMINVAPRHGKSELASRRFPAWLLGKAPEQTVICASYNMDKAQEFGGEVRDIVASVDYQTLFPGVSLKEDTRAKGFWRTEAGGYYIAAGVGTAVTGRGTVGPIALIDDPIKDREEADSERRRDLIKQWYSAVIMSRFPRAIVVVQTRWHEDDLSGWLLERERAGGDKWTVLDLPAIGPDGAALWPEMYPIEALERVRAATLPRDWSALFQQRPTPDEGDFFKRDWFVRYTPAQLPARLAVYATSDYAVTDQGGDRTVHRVWGIDAEGAIWMLAGWKGQASADVWIERQIDLIERFKPLAWFGEGGVIQKAIEPFLLRRLQERRAFCRLEWLASIHDKPTRARGFQARAAMGRVRVPEGADGDEWIDELLRFPAGKHDDEVDAASLIGRALDEAHPAARIAPGADNGPRDRYRARAQSGNDWKTS